MDNTILHIWAYIVENGTLLAFFLMLWTLMAKCLLIAFYFSLLYFGIVYLKKRLNKKLTVSANYYCWYCILFGIVLANLSFNDGIMSLSYYHLFALVSYTPYIYLTGCLLSAVWLFVVVFKLTALVRMNRKIRKSMKRMERYDDNEGLVERAASTLGLRRKPDIMIACHIETPVSYGFFKKTVLLPDNYEAKYSPCELYLLLLHEMTHIKHCDTAKLYIVSLAECFLWATPAMRLFVKNFKRDSEILCDNRVIGLHSSERDTYGNLILKECAYKTARFGFGFSDSYHAVENRLDALYRCKADSRFKLLTIIPMVVLVICALSYALRADWFIINEKYNSEFEITLFNAEYTKSVTLPPETCAGVYELTDGNIIIDTDALDVLTRPYASNGYSQVVINSNNFFAETDKSIVSSSYHRNFDIHEQAGEQELSAPFSEQLRQRTPAEYLFLLIISKL